MSMECVPSRVSTRSCHAEWRLNWLFFITIIDCNIERNHEFLQRHLPDPKTTRAIVRLMRAPKRNALSGRPHPELRDTFQNLPGSVRAAP